MPGFLKVRAHGDLQDIPDFDTGTMGGIEVRDSARMVLRSLHIDVVKQYTYPNPHVAISSNLCRRCRQPLCFWQEAGSLLYVCIWVSAFTVQGFGLNPKPLWV